MSNYFSFCLLSLDIQDPKGIDLSFVVAEVLPVMPYACALLTGLQVLYR